MGFTSLVALVWLGVLKIGEWSKKWICQCLFWGLKRGNLSEAAERKNSKCSPPFSNFYSVFFSLTRKKASVEFEFFSFRQYDSHFLARLMTCHQMPHTKNMAYNMTLFLASLMTCHQMPHTQNMAYNMTLIFLQVLWHVIKCHTHKTWLTISLSFSCKSYDMSSNARHTKHGLYYKHILAIILSSKSMSFELFF